MVMNDSFTGQSTDMNNRWQDELKMTKLNLECENDSVKKRIIDWYRDLVAGARIMFLATGETLQDPSGRL